MSESPDTDAPSRFLIGIDLGTTNSAMAYVDTAEKKWIVRDFSIPQLVAASTVEARQTLPSFHYEAGEAEFPAGALRLPWSVDEPKHAVGAFARDHGALAPGRLVVSAKSWLSHSGVDRTAGLLPWHGAADVERLSPVDVSARYLAHLRAAWDHQFPEHPMAGQDVVLAVPASFDEVARELTIDAARRAGFVHVVLVEEPQAAFYAWIYAQGEHWERRVKSGQKILICDVGGGTSDFTLIRVRPAESGNVIFHRVAVGEHLILGGDNLDLAIAHHVEQKIGRKLEPRHWGTLVRSGRIVKETLLGENPPARTVINVAAGGSKFVGGATRVELTREEVLALLLEGFLPRVRLDDKPLSHTSGFREFGLPYARDAAITRYLAAFLSTHRSAGQREGEQEPTDHDPARPDMVLFNGGLFESPTLRDRLLDVLASWFAPSPPYSGERAGVRGGAEGAADSQDSKRPLDGASQSTAPPVRPLTPALSPEYGGEGAEPPAPSREHCEEEAGPPALSREPGGEGEGPSTLSGEQDDAKGWFPEVLRNDRLDLAVSRGAAYYGMVRRGHGVRISGGLAHSYYVGVETAPGAATGAAPEAAPGDATDASTASAVCLLPAGVEEGQTVDLSGRSFNLLIRQPVEFPLYASSTRTTDQPGQILAVDPQQMSALPPIRTVLQSGKKAAAESVQVRLHARLTEIGTLDIWCAEVTGDRTWRLQFDVRAATRADIARHEGAAEAQGVLDEKVAQLCRERIVAAFARGGGTAERPESLVKKLEDVTAIARGDWPSTLLRSMWEVLLEVEPGRRISDVHEARWLNFTGYCLRPGYGLAADDWRVAQTWKLMPAGVIHPKNELVRAEWWILWRRLAGGMTPGQQRTAADPLIADWRTWFRKSGSNVRGRSPTFQFGPHESAEVWRFLGSLELLPPATKLEIGGFLLDRLPRESAASVREALFFALGRTGARTPMYGPLNALVPAETAEEWARRIMTGKVQDDKAAFAIVQLCRKTGDRYRDVSDEARSAALTWLAERNSPEHFQHLVREGGQLQAEEQRIVFGESLPRGLRIE